MTMLNDGVSAEEVEELLDQLDANGAAQILFDPDAVAEDPAIPTEWRSILAAGESRREAALEHLRPLAAVLPRVLALLPRRLVDVALISRPGERIALVYFIREAGELYGYVGYPPASESALRSIPAGVRAEVAAFYEVHDGWVDLFAADGGPLPLASWQRATGNGSEGAGALLTAYANGTHKVGFTASGAKPAVYSLWPDDDEVVEVDAFWTTVDEEMGTSLEDCDDIGRGVSLH